MLEVIGGSSQVALTLTRMSDSSKVRIEHLAESTGDDDLPADPLTSDIVNKLKVSTGQGSERDQDQEGSDDDECLDELYELMEKYEAENSSTSIQISPESEPNDKRLAREAASHCFSTDDELTRDGDPWVQEQQAETLEKEQTKVETELATKILSKGIKIQGKTFMKIAEQAVAES